MIVRHDIHNHSLLSSCCYDPDATFEAFFRRAKELGHTVFGISNHLWDEKVPGASHWYHQQMINYGLEGARNSVPEIDGIRFMVGSETEYCGLTDTLGMLAETAARFDYMLVPHTHMHMKNFVIAEAPDVKAKRRELADKLIAAMPELRPELAVKMVNGISHGDVEAMLTERTIDVVQYNADFMVESFKKLMNNVEFNKLKDTVPTGVAHPFHPCGFGNDMRKKIMEAVTDEAYAECFAIARDKGVNIEINTGAFTLTENDYAEEPGIRVMRIAREVGVKFTFGTDTHSLKGLDSIRKGDRISELCGITEDDVAEFVKA